MNTAERTDEFEVITEEYESVDEQQADKAFRRLLKRDVPEFLDQMSLLVSQEVTKHLELSNTSLPFSLFTSFTYPLFISLLFIYMFIFRSFDSNRLHLLSIFSFLCR